jgi:hypothetical protein
VLLGLDVEWLCPVLFAHLSAENLFFLYIAALLEKSIVMVSHDLNVVSSCVLGLQAMMRPLKWTHVSIPLLPRSLSYVLESPVPFMAGIPYTDMKQPREDYAIWVWLDDGGRIDVCELVRHEVCLPFASNLYGRIARKMVGK